MLPVVTTAATVPAVKASQTLSAYTVDTFTATIQNQVSRLLLHLQEVLALAFVLVFGLGFTPALTPCLCPLPLPLHSPGLCQAAGWHGHIMVLSTVLPRVLPKGKERAFHWSCFLQETSWKV